MLDAIGQVLPMAIGVALSPMPIIAVVLMLVGVRARVNGPMFVVGWLVGLLLVGTVVLVAAGPLETSDGGEPTTWVGVLKLVLGGLLLLVAVKQWLGRPATGERVDMPKWMGAIDSFTPVRSMAVAAAFSGLNPKNLLLAVGAAVAITGTGIAGVEQAVAYGVFAVLGTVGVAIPVVIYFALGDRAPRVLGNLQDWMVLHNAVIMAVLSLVIGVKLLGDGLAAL